MLWTDAACRDSVTWMIQNTERITKIPIRSHGLSVRGSVSLLLQLLIDFPGGREPAYGPTTDSAAAAPTLPPAAVETAQGKWQ